MLSPLSCQLLVCTVTFFLPKYTLQFEWDILYFILSCCVPGGGVKTYELICTEWNQKLFYSWEGRKGKQMHQLSCSWSWVASISLHGTKWCPPLQKHEHSLFSHIKFIVCCDCCVLISWLLNIHEPITKNKFIALALSQVLKDSNIYANERLYLMQFLSHPTLFPFKWGIKLNLNVSPPLHAALLFALIMPTPGLWGVYMRTAEGESVCVHIHMK